MGDNTNDNMEDNMSKQTVKSAAFWEVTMTVTKVFRTEVEHLDDLSMEEAMGRHHVQLAVREAEFRDEMADHLAFMGISNDDVQVTSQTNKSVRLAVKEVK